jgi:hypothetical protein
VAYLRLSPAAGRELLLKWLNDDQRRRTAIEAAGKSFVRSGDTKIVRALTARAVAADRRELEAICNALNSIGGDAAHAAIEQYAAQLNPALLAQLRQSRTPVSIAAIADAVTAVGLLSKTDMELAVQQLATEENERQPGLFELLYVAKSALAFDVETGMLPCRHDNLVREFANASRGRFQPEAVLEIWQRSKDDDFEAPYTLQFVVNQNLYRAELRNLGDWYDVERVVQSINAALSQANILERFVGLATDGQVAQFVFADPKLLAGIAEKFHMPLSDDFESAMRQGIEFENHVRQQLRKSAPVDATNVAK